MNIELLKNNLNDVSKESLDYISEYSKDNNISFGHTINSLVRASKIDMEAMDIISRAAELIKREQESDTVAHNLESKCESYMPQRQLITKYAESIYPDFRKALPGLDEVEL